MKRMAKDWLRVLILLLDGVVIVGAVLVLLWYFDIKLPLWAAKSVEGEILAGQIVEIQSINKLVLEFSRKGW
jgi:hypothetical protein